MTIIRLPITCQDGDVDGDHVYEGTLLDAEGDYYAITAMDGMATVYVDGSPFLCVGYWELDAIADFISGAPE